MSDSLRYARAMDYFGMIKAASQEIPKDTESLKVFAIQAEMASRQILVILNETQPEVSEER